MTKLITMVLAAFATAYSAFSNAALVTLNFDALAPGNKAEALLGNANVSFNNTGGDFFGVTACELLPDFTCGNAILNAPYDTAGNSTIATFSSVASFVSVVLGDYGADADDLFLYAYDAANVLIGSDFFADPENGDLGRTLSVAAPNIHHVEFYSVGFTDNSAFWDNFTYDLAPANVPAPTTLLLFCLGLAALTWSRWREHRNADSGLANPLSRVSRMGQGPAHCQLPGQ